MAGMHGEVPWKAAKFCSQSGHSGGSTRAPLMTNLIDSVPMTARKRLVQASGRLDKPAMVFN